MPAHAQRLHGACRIILPMHLCALSCLRSQEFEQLLTSTDAGVAAVVIPGSFGPWVLACAASLYVLSVVCLSTALEGGGSAQLLLL